MCTLTALQCCCCSAWPQLQKRATGCSGHFAFSKNIIPVHSDCESCCTRQLILKFDEWPVPPDHYHLKKHLIQPRYLPSSHTARASRLAACIFSPCSPTIHANSTVAAAAEVEAECDCGSHDAQPVFQKSGVFIARLKPTHLAKHTCYIPFIWHTFFLSTIR